MYSIKLRTSISSVQGLLPEDGATHPANVKDFLFLTGLRNGCNFFYSQIKCVVSVFDASFYLNDKIHIG